MNVPLNKLTVICISSLSLFGCNGDSSSSSSSQDKLAGKLIDGYISGATIFMDLNFNSQLDAGEPSTKTDANGSFKFTQGTISAQPCWKHVPIVAVVPIGAIDSDEPNTPITKPYVMTYPPLSFKKATSDVYVTPISTEVWDGANNSIHLDGLEIGCTELTSDDSKMDELKQLVAKEEVRMAEKYATSSLNLYTDYIASGNSTLHLKAKDTVKQLKSAYESEKTLRESTPEASYIKVSYFEDDGDTIRYQHITTEDGYIRQYDHVDDDNLDSVLSLETREVMSYRYNDDKSIKLESSYFLDDRDTSTGTYTCTYLENYKQVGSGTRYNIENQAFSAAVNDMAECKTINLTSNSDRQVLGVRTRNGNILTNKTRLKYPYDPNLEVNGYKYGQHFNLNNDPNEMTHDILNRLSFIEIDFESTESYDAPSWARARYDYSQATNYLVKDVHENGGHWFRDIEYFDGQVDTICGDSLASLDTNSPIDSCD